MPDQEILGFNQNYDFRSNLQKRKHVRLKTKVSNSGEGYTASGQFI